MVSTVILMRHGDYSDDTFELNEDGREQSRNVAKQLIEAGIRPDAILYSPVRRATQTAAIVAEEFTQAGLEVNVVREEQDLKCERERIPLALGRLNVERTVLAISHAPDIEAAVKTMTGERREPGYANALVVQSDSDDWRSTVGNNSSRVTQLFRPTR